MRIVIVGMGEVGSYLAEILSKDKNDVIGIDMDRRKLTLLEDQLDIQIIEGYGAAPKVLKQADVGSADIFLAVSNNDEVNLVSALIAQRLGASFTVARVSNANYLDEEQLGEYGTIGIDMVISPERRTALTIFQAIEYPYFLKVNAIGRGNVFINQFLVTHESPFTYKKIKDIALDPDILIVGINRRQNFMFPNGETTIFPHDTLFLAGKKKAMDGLSDLFPIAQKKIKRILILGGSSIAFSLARLAENKYRVIIIEPDAERSNRVAQALINSTVYNLDVFESSAMDELQPNENDYFIAATGNDEINFLSAILMRDRGVSMIAMVMHNSQLLNIVTKMGIYQVFSPRMIISNDIVRAIRERDLITLHSIKNVSAEFVEFHLKSHSPLVDKQIRDLKLPSKTILIAAIRGKEVLIIKGNAILQADDYVVVLCLKKNQREIEKLFNP